MFGIIATIVAANKGHYGYATFTGIWTALAVIIALGGAPQFAVGPGALFLVIALSMGKVNQEGAEKPSDPAPPEPNLPDQGKFICTACGHLSSGWYQTCPRCGAVGRMERNTRPAARTAETVPEPVKPAVPALTEPAYSIRWLTGPYAGQRVAVQGQMTIGRDAGNSIVFSDHTKGVSGRHCRIVISDGRFCITDLGSTYGTVGNGVHRLPPNQPVILRPGDRIALGSEGVMFEVME